MVKKNIVLTLLLAITTVSVFSAEESSLERERLQYGRDYIVTGKLNDISGNGTVSVKPDQVESYFELQTEADTVEKASTENAKIMDELKKYLLSLGINEKDIETSRYSKGEKEIRKPEGKISYKTVFQAAVSIEKDKFYQVTDILNNENIAELKNYDSNQPQKFYFTIEAKDSNKESSRKIAKTKYDRIESALNKVGIKDIALINYNISEEEERETQKLYTITHSFKVKMKTDVDMAKLLKRCEELGIKNPGNMTYGISDELKETLVLEAYKKAMEDLYAKAEAILSVRGYKVGDVDIWDRSNINGLISSAPVSSIMMNQRSLKANYMLNDEAITEEVDIPFSAPQEMKITVTLTANFDIINKVK